MLKSNLFTWSCYVAPCFRMMATLTSLNEKNLFSTDRTHSIVFEYPISTVATIMNFVTSSVFHSLLLTALSVVILNSMLDDAICYVIIPLCLVPITMFFFRIFHNLANIWLSLSLSMFVLFFISSIPARHAHVFEYLKARVQHILIHSPFTEKYRWGFQCSTPSLVFILLYWPTCWTKTTLFSLMNLNSVLRTLPESLIAQKKLRVLRIMTPFGKPSW